MKPISLIAVVLIATGLLLTLDHEAGVAGEKITGGSKKLGKKLRRQKESAAESLGSLTGQLAGLGKHLGEQTAHLMDEAAAAGKRLKKKAKTRFI